MKRGSMTGLCAECGQRVDVDQVRCETCERRIRKSADLKVGRESRRADRVKREPWTLDAELRKWQSEALAKWVDAGSRGVVEAATGTGKTALACAAVERLHQVHREDLRVAIVVPTIALAKQWRVEVSARLALKGSLIGDQHSEEVVSWDSAKPVLITVINTASNRLTDVVANWKTSGCQVLLIVDECHRSGAESFSKIFDADFDFSLGLSATPERSDEGELEFIYPRIGPKIFEYSLLQALDDRVLSDLTALNLYVDFSPSERSKWERNQTDFSQAFAAFCRAHPSIKSGSPRLFDEISKLAKDDDPHARKIVKLLAGRKALINGSRQRARCAWEALGWIHATGKKAIIFHETIGSAQESLEALQALGARAVLEHSALSDEKRQVAIKNFRSGRSRILVTVKALDEGLDVPEAEIALIVSGSRSHRQRIQRIGRILRSSENKHARVITILVSGTPEEVVVGARDPDRLGVNRVRHHRYRSSVDFDSLFALPSRHKPDSSLIREPIDRLTLRSLVDQRIKTIES
jgi:superfamily II DNA or RNA helicase